MDDRAAELASIKGDLGDIEVSRRLQIQAINRMTAQLRGTPGGTMVIPKLLDLIVDMNAAWNRTDYAIARLTKLASDPDQQ